MNTKGADYNPGLTRKETDIEILKGQMKMVDSYSAFGSNNEDTGLHKILGENHIDEVYCVGLTFDYGVGMTALDASKRCFKTHVVEDACASLNPSSDTEMRQMLKKIGVNFILSEEVK